MTDAVQHDVQKLKNMIIHGKWSSLVWCSINMEPFSSTDVHDILLSLQNKANSLTAKIFIVDPCYKSARQLCHAQDGCVERLRIIGNFIRVYYKDTSAVKIYLTSVPITQNFIVIDDIVFNIMMRPIYRLFQMAACTSIQNRHHAHIMKECSMTMYEKSSRLVTPEYAKYCTEFASTQKETFRKYNESAIDYCERVFTPEIRNQLTTLVCTGYYGSNDLYVILDPAKDTLEKFSIQYKRLSEDFNVDIRISPHHKDLQF